MDLISVFMLCLMSCLIGAVSTLLIEYVIFMKFMEPSTKKKEEEIRPHGFVIEDFAIPEALMCNIKSANTSTKDGIMAFNLVFQFLFFDLRYSTRVRNWFYRKITHEMDELIQKTSVSKFFEKFAVRDLDFGTEFPEVKDVRVHNVDLHETEGYIETLDLVLDVQYNGNFKLAIDGDMVMDKNIFLTVKVKHVSGLCRLRFTRKPYSHWSICFIGEPRTEMDITTHFQGRSIQQSLVNLLSNQIRKAIRRKHTLPIFKIRYKPFFQKFAQEFDLAEIDPSGRLDVNICELSRLQLPTNINYVFCTITVSPFAWVLARQVAPNKLIITIDVTMHRAKNQQIGITFRQSDSAVIVESIIPNTPATMANILPDDVLLYIENNKITQLTQVHKIVKALTKKDVTIRLERLVDGSIYNDNGCDHHLDAYEDMDDFSNIAFSKEADCVQIGQKTKAQLRKRSHEKLTTTESNQSLPNSSTPPVSPKKSPLQIQVNEESPPSSSPLLRTSSTSIRSQRSANTSCSSMNESEKDEEKEETLMDVDEEFIPLMFPQSIIEEKIQQHTTIDVLAKTTVQINDLTHFELTKDSHWLNLCVFGRCNDEVELLGYSNVPVSNMLMECSESNLWQIIKKFTLIPPTPPDLSNHPLSGMNGFEPRLCYGDALLSFVWSGVPVEQKRNFNKKVDVGTTYQHNFVRTHFSRAAHCDFCGKKIWLKEAAQCTKCSMSCHKKCIKKCQLSTVCTIAPSDTNSSGQTGTQQQSGLPSFKLVEEDNTNGVEYLDPIPDSEHGRFRLSTMIAHNIKRVNSAHNLSIPGMGLSPGHSRSLPQSPQHSPRKQSLVNASTNPFVAVVQKLEQLPDNAENFTEEQICALTEPLINCGSSEELMGLAKTASRSLYGELEPTDRVQKINLLLARLRIALDVETTKPARIVAEFQQQQEPGASSSNASPTTTPSHRLASSSDGARQAFLIGQSEERVQALSVIMLFLCSGLQHAQGVAS